ncbi:MAG: hypothetical protein AB7G11_01385 [Phycisphaerales bacterium]
MTPSPTTPAEPTHPRAARRWLVLSVAVAAALVFIALVAYMRSMEARSLKGVADPLLVGPAASLTQTARVAESVRAMKLVTVQISTRVSAQSSDSSWRGDASAIVDAPVRLHYGTDLSAISDGAISFSPLLNQCTLRVPPPHRIATEVIGTSEQSEIHVGWLRFRSQAGEKHLGQARLRLYERAQDLRLLPADAQSVREQTREQVAKLVQGIVGHDVEVQVQFEDEGTGLGMAGTP